jgi:hypothetical protein
MLSLRGPTGEKEWIKLYWRRRGKICKAQFDLFAFTNWEVKLDAAKALESELNRRGNGVFVSCSRYIVTMYGPRETFHNLLYRVAQFLSDRGNLYDVRPSMFGPSWRKLCRPAENVIPFHRIQARRP